MRSFAVAAVSAFAAVAAASPVAEPEARSLQFKNRGHHNNRDFYCLNDNHAQQVATNFGNLISAYSDDLARAALTDDFTDYTDGVWELINSGCTVNGTLGTPTFSTLEAFIAGQGAQPLIPFEQLNIWHTCNTVIIRWRTALTPQFVTGLIVMETEKAPAGNEYPFQIKTLYSEFNSGAWLVDLGVFQPACPANGTAPPPPPMRKL